MTCSQDLWLTAIRDAVCQSGLSTHGRLACREKKSVVVAIRGTQSIADLVTDAVVHPEPMESWVPKVVFSSFCQRLSKPISF